MPFPDSGRRVSVSSAEETRSADVSSERAEPGNEYTPSRAALSSDRLPSSDRLAATDRVLPADRLSLTGKQSAHDFCSTFERSSLAVLVLGADSLIWARNPRALEWGIDAAVFDLPVVREAKHFAQILAGASRGRTASLWLSQVPGG
jgi:hypothetical protein